MQHHDSPGGPFWDAIDAHYRAVFGFAWRMTGERTVAEDVTQEAFARLAQSALRDGGVEESRRWVFVVARNLCISHLRRRTRHPETELGHGLPARAAGPADAMAANERAALVQAAVHALPVDMREAIVLREYEGLSYEAIASIVDCPLGTVKSRIARARELLRHQLRNVLEMDE